MRKKADIERTCQPELGMGLDGRYHPAEHGSGNYVHFVQKDKSPFSGCQELHHLLGLVRPIVRIRDHGVGRNDYATITGELKGR